MSRVRQLSGGGPPGADAPTHRSHKGIRGAGAVTSTSRRASEIDDADDGEGEGRQYPSGTSIASATGATGAPCTRSIPPHQGASAGAAPTSTRLRRPLTRLGIGLDRCHRQTQGDDIDIDAAVEARVETLAGSAPGRSRLPGQPAPST